jgi:hypothetical protein
MSFIAYRNKVSQNRDMKKFCEKCKFENKQMRVLFYVISLQLEWSSQGEWDGQGM